MRALCPTVAFLVFVASATVAQADPAPAVPGPSPDARSTLPETPASELDQLVDGVTARYNLVSQMRTRFTQTVHQKTIKRPRKASGTLEFQRPGRMRWEYKKPEPVLYVSDGAVLWVYQPEDALAYRTRVEGSRAYTALRFLFGMGDLRESFVVSLKAGPDAATATLVLVPKESDQDCQQLELVVDRTTFEIRESVLTDPVGNVTRYVFQAPDYEAAIPAERFRFTPPPGTTVKDL